MLRSLLFSWFKWSTFIIRIMKSASFFSLSLQRACHIRDSLEMILKLFQEQKKIRRGEDSSNYTRHRLGLFQNLLHRVFLLWVCSLDIYSFRAGTLEKDLSCLAYILCLLNVAIQASMAIRIDFPLDALSVHLGPRSKVWSPPLRSWELLLPGAVRDKQGPHARMECQSGVQKQGAKLLNMQRARNDIWKDVGFLR